MYIHKRFTNMSGPLGTQIGLFFGLSYSTSASCAPCALFGAGVGGICITCALGYSIYEINRNCRSYCYENASLCCINTPIFN